MALRRSVVEPVLAAVACVVLAAVLTGAEVQTLDTEELPDVGADVKHAMDEAAKAANAAALAEAARETAEADDQVKQIEKPRGIPSAVVDALSTQNIRQQVRETLEKIGLPKVSNASTPEERVALENQNRIRAATANALAIPEIMKAAAKVTSEVAEKEAHTKEAKSQFENQVSVTIGQAAKKATDSARVQAEQVLKKAQQTQQVMAGLEHSGQLNTPTAEASAQAQIAKASREEKEAEAFLQNDGEKAEVANEVKAAMQKETTQFEAQIKPSAEELVKQKLAREVALAAQREMQLLADQAQTKARVKAEADATKAIAVAEEKAAAHKSLTVAANKGEAAKFSQEISVHKVTGYWSNRRRFAQQKHFVQYGNFDEPPHPREQDKKEQVKAEAHMEQAEKDIDEKEKEEEAQLIEEQMQKKLPQGSVQQMVNKLAKREVSSEADKITDAAQVASGDNDVSDAVKALVQAQEVDSPASTKTSNHTRDQ